MLTITQAYAEGLHRFRSSQFSASYGCGAIRPTLRGSPPMRKQPSGLSDQEPPRPPDDNTDLLTKKARMPTARPRL